LINSQRVTFPPGTILLSKDRSSDFIYLILTGFVEYINSEKNIISHRSVGSILGEMSIIQKRPVEGTYRTSCYVNALKISATTFMYFINRSQLKKKLLLLQEKRHFILNHSKIGSVLNYIQLNEMIESCRNE
jgi:signal-transduction protein with cAMP-binding, CBS, and nucleotidyltransferase domain